ncbi:MAG: cupin domain-containing protein [Proteobacteria bacterium]|nr:cupin domain-containing protein [Pseudomonadota bacterium]
MTLEIRRVVTGHDDAGKATIKYDEISTNVTSGRPGQAAAVIWTTDRSPANNTGETDEALLPVGTTHPGGSVFRIVEYQPGVSPRNHRTDSVDYAVVMSGEIDMGIDDETVHLKAGDVLVQRGTIHNWVNNGTVPCVIAFVLVSAEPWEKNGVTLDAVG